jgi:acylphosphatase
METEQTRLHAVVEGRVQGVGFRAFVERNAWQLSVTGWVRNRWDGTVEVLAEGERASLDQLLSALRRGPSASRVKKVKPHWKPASGEFSRFSMRPTV